MSPEQEAQLLQDVADLKAKTSVDLSPYALKSDIPVIPASPDLSVYALKTDIPVVPASPDLSGFALKADIPKIPDLSVYALKDETPSNLDLHDYALKAEIPAPFPGIDLSDYVTKSQVAGLVPKPDLTQYALKSDLVSISTQSSSGATAGHNAAQILGSVVEASAFTSGPEITLSTIRSVFNNAITVLSKGD
jgi:hypothetical protein